MVSLSDLRRFKADGRKFSCLTCYDASMAKAMEIAEVDSILIGDSLGMSIQGRDSTLPVTVADMAYHTAAVRRGNQHAFIMTDLPFMSYATLTDALQSSKTVMQAGAQMVKMEGGAWLADTVQVLTRNGIPVCVHLGLTPQSVHVFGGYKLQARTREAADQLIADCKAVVEAGAALLLLECVPAQLGQEITELFPQIPVIGIGAGAATDGQVLVVQDMLGLTFGHTAKFVRNFMQEQSGATAILDAFKAYHAAVLDGSFPAPEQTFQVEL
ncbi:3-methyl-2-oxobutanoate hydroxymethyltransferase [Acinetobacter lwoffii]|jgi:3-methyl-2-oxobutanoate hydroxymethyltransferase|uniref:3-methyl-2-oxobutanoate hydroxymethyltransferase n=1 Tax=Acinetobacter TaxID=469 RepID=UPI0009000430|nr:MULTISPECIES: 3-methyl-2-oxobutanoate hydroxymethyltransferase [Acinetobacter]MCJ0926784.1 3-methyl-2-oxobutanoate hydroxymethyltransferase [Acinetobacter lwoffii]MCO8072597.1 3-methyl-2-oxobutanoate hydroxymethyltransferase [Acinetobacter lwoffii]MCO8075575.1 3-methyl-2-oxobutanoate hydroxymethyltransferase [Acinetobacter lwoffii]MCO8083804.1 3-methyl-2-oxobutanoate hydroxymethyltransferase [Acinetobacter lwoffii]OIU86478.1 3-methyl-2-oxobutanoate hydroxymethyltransferase [Acinetobacter sp